MYTHMTTVYGGSMFMYEKKWLPKYSVCITNFFTSLWLVPYILPAVNISGFSILSKLVFLFTGFG